MSRINGLDQFVKILNDLLDAEDNKWAPTLLFLIEVAIILALLATLGAMICLT